MVTQPCPAGEALAPRCYVPCRGNIGFHTPKRVSSTKLGSNIAFYRISRFFGFLFSFWVNIGVPWSTSVSKNGSTSPTLREYHIVSLSLSHLCWRAVWQCLPLDLRKELQAWIHIETWSNLGLIPSLKPSIQHKKSHEIQTETHGKTKKCHCSGGTLETSCIKTWLHLLRSLFGPTCSASAKRFNDSKQAAQDAYRNWFHVRDANFRRFWWSFCIKIGSLFRLALR